MTTTYHPISPEQAIELAKRNAEVISFNPLLEVPDTDDKAVIALLYNRDEFIGKCLVGIYICYRKEGLEILAAYKNTLLDSLQACK